MASTMRAVHGPSGLFMAKQWGVAITALAELFLSRSPRRQLRSRCCIIAGVPKRTGVESDDEADDAADITDMTNDAATEPASETPSSPVADGPDDQLCGTGEAAAGSPLGAAPDPRRQSDGRRWSWMEGGDAGQPADNRGGADPFQQEDQVSAHHCAAPISRVCPSGLLCAAGHCCCSRAAPVSAFTLAHDACRVCVASDHSSFQQSCSSHTVFRCCAGHHVRGDVTDHAARGGARPPGRLRLAAALCRRPASRRCLHRHRPGGLKAVLLRCPALLVCSAMALPLPSLSAPDCTACPSPLLSCILTGTLVARKLIDRVHVDVQSQHREGSIQVSAAN